MNPRNSRAQIRELLAEVERNRLIEKCSWKAGVGIIKSVQPMVGPDDIDDDIVEEYYLNQFKVKEPQSYLKESRRRIFYGT